MKKTFASAKNFVVANKTTVVLVATVALAAAAAAIAVSDKKEIAEFLTESETLTD